MLLFLFYISHPKVINFLLFIICGNLSRAKYNYIRSRRSAAGKTLPLLTSVTLEDILNERGYELYWEGYRRQDLVRFGRFGDAWYEKPATDESKALFYIPTSALDTNENLHQNP